LAERALGRLAHRRERFGQQVVELAPRRDLLAEPRRTRPELVVREFLDVGLEGVDPGHAHAESFLSLRSLVEPKMRLASEFRAIMKELKEIIR
jgi:hypothetical protein